MKEFSDLVGKTIAAIDQTDGDLLRITLTDGTVCELYHGQDCCEHVTIESVNGTLADLIGSPLTEAKEESMKRSDPEGYVHPENRYRDSWTWTIYTLATEQHSVTIRWLGESNGYYSESAHFRVVAPVSTSR